MSKKPIILFLSWRDFEHPESGGAEVFTSHMIEKCESRKRFNIIHFSTLKNGKSILRKNNIIYIKKGNWMSVIFHAIAFYLSNKERIKLVIDQCNTHRFFSPLWVPKHKNALFIHQFTREIWKTKFNFLLASIGEILENSLIRPYKNRTALTVSPSTKKDLVDTGFRNSKIHIMPEGVEHTPCSLPLLKKSQEQPLFLYVGRYSQYKGLPDSCIAFGHFVKKKPNAQFIIIGSKNEDYIKSTLKPICDEYDIKLTNTFSRENKNTITLLGRVSEKEKLKYMSLATALVYPSKREGWGLSVTEAAILGTPSIVYNSAGLIDAVNNGTAGYLCEKNNSQEIYRMMKLTISNPDYYEKIRLEAYNFSKQFRWENTAIAFDKYLTKGLTNAA